MYAAVAPSEYSSCRRDAAALRSPFWWLGKDRGRQAVVRHRYTAMALGGNMIADNGNT